MDAYTEFAVTAEDAARIASAVQRSPQWLAARRGRLTGSNFAAAAGHNPFMTRQQLVEEMLRPTFHGNDATQWGQDHEPVARDMYTWAMRKVRPELRVDEVGLQVSPELPFLGVSPDGVCTIRNGERYLLEIKCPYRWRPDGFYKDIVPTYYWDQLQGSMALLGLPYAHFVVYTPVAMQVTVVKFDEPYWRTTLLPALLHFYINDFYPAWRAMQEEQ